MELGTAIQRTSEDEFGAPEGSANLYYGMIRSGKTYGATADILEELDMGRLVYATWPVSTEQFDDRESLWMIIKNTITLRKKFYKINCPKNFHYIDAEKGEVDGKYTFNPKYPSEYIEYLNTLTHCSLYVDEAWRVIDSYQGTKMGVESRNLVLVTGHKFRTVNLIAQRPTSIHVVARGNMNRFYKFVKLSSWPWIRFARYEFQTMEGETVDENQEPISIKTYWASKRVFNAYNTHAYGGQEPLHKTEFDLFLLSFHEKLFALAYKFHILKQPKPWYELIPSKRCMPTRKELWNLSDWDIGQKKLIRVQIHQNNDTVSQRQKVIHRLSTVLMNLTKPINNPKIRTESAIPQKGSQQDHALDFRGDIKIKKNKKNAKL